MQTDVTQVSENQFLFNIPDADDINHLVIFMTGQSPFPDGLGAAGIFLNSLQDRFFLHLHVSISIHCHTCTVNNMEIIS